MLDDIGPHNLAVIVEDFFTPPGIADGPLIEGLSHLSIGMIAALAHRFTKFQVRLAPGDDGLLGYIKQLPQPFIGGPQQAVIPRSVRIFRAVQTGMVLFLG